MTLTPQQLKELATGLGGSDALTYANIDPRKSALQLYADFIEGRRGKVDPLLEKDPRVEFGRRLEPVMKDWLQEETGREVKTAYLPTLRHPELPYLIGHLDGKMDEDGVEFKTGDKFTAREWGEVGTDEVPIRYVCQVMHYMAVSRIEQFHVAVLLGGNDPRHYVVQRDQELVSMLVTRAQEFWRHIENRVPPDPVTLEDCAWRWPASQEVVLKASEPILETFLKLDGLRRQERAACRQADELEVEIKAFMGNAAILTNGQAPYPIATWRSQERQHIDIKALEKDHPELVAQYRRVNSHRVFRLK